MVRSYSNDLVNESNTKANYIRDYQDTSEVDGDRLPHNDLQSRHIKIDLNLTFQSPPQPSELMTPIKVRPTPLKYFD